MGTLEAPPHDLKVTVQSTSLVFSSQQTEERKSMFLSNIDRVLNFDVQTVHFFPHCSEFPPQTMADRLKKALSSVLVAYDFLAGRLKSNNGDVAGRLEIDCNGAGVGFVVATCEYSLDEIGDLVYPNPGFRQLVVQSFGDSVQRDRPLFILQVTTFKCGGFAMGISNNHATFDGLSFKIFLENLASQAYDHDKPLPFPPCNDRHLLAARSPPRVTFPHHELLKFEIPTGGELEQTPPVFESSEENLDFKIFNLSPDDLSLLKKKAKTKGGEENKAKLSGFNVVVAHVWRCKALSYNSGSVNPDRMTTVLYAVDIRSRLCPPLPLSYTGNAVLTAYATTECNVLKEGPFSKLVEMVGEGAGRMTDEYARSAIDWGEVYKGFPNGEFLVSSWWKLGFAQVEYPWGKPRYSCPVVYHRKDIILLFPDIKNNKNINNNNNGKNEDGDNAGHNNEGVNVLVALPAKEMEVFTTLFHDYLQN